MGLFGRLVELLGAGRPVPVSEWFSVQSDGAAVRISARPPGGAPWEVEFRWDEIERVCFKAEGLGASDGIYVFTRGRPESYSVPVEARGGVDFWGELIGRGLFSAELAIEAAQAGEGVWCWPEEADE